MYAVLVKLEYELPVLQDYNIYHQKYKYPVVEWGFDKW